MFKTILSKLVESIPGAACAVFVDWEGETVDAYALDGDEYHVKFVGAHNGVLLDAAKRLAKAVDMGETRQLMIRSDKHDYVTWPVHDGYFIVLTVKSGTQLVRVEAALGEAVASLKKEMGY